MARVTANGLEYEPDPRHVESLANSMNTTTTNSAKTPGVKDPVTDCTIAKKDDQPTTVTNLGNHLAPSSSQSSTGRNMRCATMTDQDPDPDDMDVDRSMGVDCSATDILVLRRLCYGVYGR